MKIPPAAPRWLPSILLLLSAGVTAHAQPSCTVECVTAAFCTVPGGGQPVPYYYSLEYFTRLQPCRDKIAEFRATFQPFPEWCAYETGDPTSTFAGLGTKLHAGADQGGTIAVNDNIDDSQTPRPPTAGPPCDFTPHCSTWQQTSANCYTSVCDGGAHNITMCNTPFPAGNGWAFVQPPGNSCAPTQAATMLMRICGVCVNPANWASLPPDNTFGNTANAMVTALQQLDCGCRKPDRVTCDELLGSMNGANGCSVLVSTSPPTLHWITVTNGSCRQTASGWSGTVQWADGDGTVGTFDCGMLYDACSAVAGIIGGQGGGVCFR